MTPDPLDDEERARKAAEHIAEQTARAGFSKRFLELEIDKTLFAPEVHAFAPTRPAPGKPFGLLLVGPTGVGKSVQAQALLRLAINRGMTGFRVTLHELTFALWKKDERKRAAARSRELLVLDDMGSSHETSWVLSEIDALIDVRSDACLSTIITSNVSPWKRDAGDESIEARYPRVWSRIREDGPGLILVDGPDLRLRDAKKKNLHRSEGAE